MAEAVLSPRAPNPARQPNDCFRLLCACACANPGPEQAARISGWKYEGLDWAAFVRLAEHHGVLPLVARNLTRCADGLPQEVAQSLRSAYEANLRRSLWFAGELSRILAHFHARQLRAIPYKGPVLAQTAYGDLGLRSFSDLDLLIANADFTRAKEALGEIGYYPSHDYTPSVERFWLRKGYERSFDGAAGKNLLELQWNLLPHFYAVDFRTGDFRVEDLYARATIVDLAGVKTPSLAPEDSLLALCLHAAKHLWTRLIWVADIAESLRQPGLDFAAAVSRARAMGIARVVGVSCLLAERLLGAPIGPSLREWMERDSETAKLGSEYAGRLAQSATYNFESVDYYRRIWNLRERARDRSRYLWRLVCTTGHSDMAAVKLPEWLFFLYPAVRFGRLLRRVV